MPEADAFIKHPDIEVSVAEAFPKFDRPEARGSDIPHNSEGGGVRAETFLEFQKAGGARNLNIKQHSEGGGARR